MSFAESSDDQAISLTVYFDMNCSLCQRVARWLDKQEQFVPIRCLPLQSKPAREKCPIDPDTLLEEATVIASDGSVYRGAKAFLICLWGLRRYRSVALSLSTNAMMPWAKRLFGIVARFGTVTKRGPAGIRAN